MSRTAAEALPRQLDRLEAFYGVQEAPPARGALEWILWENAAYLVRRRSATRASAR